MTRPATSSFQTRQRGQEFQPGKVESHMSMPLASQSGIKQQQWARNYTPVDEPVTAQSKRAPETWKPTDLVKEDNKAGVEVKEYTHTAQPQRQTLITNRVFKTLSDA